MSTSRAHERFRRFAERATVALGSVWMFIAAVVFTVVWAVSGFMFGFTDTWQLTVNTVASIAAFLMVFVIQNTQSRDARALHLKLDELLRVADGARIDLVDLENLSDAEMDELRRDFRRLYDEANGAKEEAERERKQEGSVGVGMPPGAQGEIRAEAAEEAGAVTEWNAGSETERKLRTETGRAPGADEQLRAEARPSVGPRTEEQRGAAGAKVLGTRTDEDLPVQTDEERPARTDEELRARTAQEPGAEAD